MQETKQPKDPKKVLWGTYLVIFAVVMLLNLWLFPKMVENRIEQVDYGTFLTMLEEGKLSTVEIEDQQIYFVDKDNVPYKTNSIPQDLDIVNRLKDAGVTFGKVYQQTSILDTILGWVISLLPMIILMVLLNRMMRSQMQKMSGGPNSMLIGGGKTGAKP